MSEAASESSARNAEAEPARSPHERPAQLRMAGLLVAAGLLVTAGCGSEQPRGAEGAAEATGDMILATTTSTQDSGLLDAILPTFEQNSDCVPKTVAVGSGQAMAMGESGDADVLLVHSPKAEEKFMAEGHGSSREPVMHNDFVLVGPPDDPAHIGAAAARRGGDEAHRAADRRRSRPGPTTPARTRRR